MSIAIIVRGHEPIIRLNQNKANTLYGFLQQYVTRKGITPQLVDPSAVVLLEPAVYVIAHSRGTNVVLDRLRDHVPSCLKAIALLDPSPDYATFWNDLRIPKIAFISTSCGRPYAEGFDHSVRVQDDHYFTQPRSQSQVQQGLDHVFVE